MSEAEMLRQIDAAQVNAKAGILALEFAERWAPTMGIPEVSLGCAKDHLLGAIERIDELLGNP